MKQLLIIITIITTTLSYAQVGIGNTNPQATLDISASNQSSPSNNDGMLIPRIDAFPATNPTATQDAMLVYLTTTDGSDSPGFYYWNNATTDWIPFGGGTIGWDLLGNSGTTSGTNFLGTTDNQALDIRTNNILRARFTTNGQIETLNTGQSVLIGEGAGAVHDNSATRRNTLIGYEAGNDVTTGFNNVALGWRTLYVNNTGVRNIAIGSSTLDRDTDPEDNVAIGPGALGNTTGVTEDSVAIGGNALSNSTDSERNVAVGRTAGANVDGPDNVFVGFQSDWLNANSGATRNVVIGSGAGRSGIGGGVAYEGRVLIGYQAGRDAGINNSLFIENSESATPLIYGEFDNDILRVGGQLQIGSSDDTTAGSIYAFPIVDGTNGQVLTTDGSGNVSWQNGGGSSTAWDLTGNAGTTNGTNFIGTTDNQALDIRTNNVIHTRFTTNGQIETLNNGQSVLIGEKAGENQDNSATRRNILIGFEAGDEVTTAFNNTVIGYRALGNAITSVNNNVAIGQNSLGSITSGSLNVALGVGALWTTNSANNSVAIGNNALSNSNASENNVAIGQAAGANADGGDNVFIGKDADSGNGFAGATRNVVIGSEAGSTASNLEGRVIIGYQAGNNSNLDNSLVIENSDSNTPLVGGDFANDRLSVNKDISSLTHTFTVGGTAKIEDVLNLQPGSAPITPAEGDVYYDSALKKLRVYTGSVWENLN